MTVEIFRQLKFMIEVSS